MATKRPKWPRITPIKLPSGNVTYQIDLGIVEGRRKRVNHSTKQEAETFAEQCRIAKANEGTTALALPMDIRLDAAKATQILAPHNVTILEVTKYYQKQ